jgi:hypothetical protein
MLQSLRVPATQQHTVMVLGKQHIIADTNPTIISNTQQQQQQQSPVSGNDKSKEQSVSSSSSIGQSGVDELVEECTLINLQPG